MKKRILCLILAAALCGGLAAATGTDAAAQYPVTYTGKVLAAVNTDLSTDAKNLTNGTFTPQQEASSLLSSLTESDQGELYGISDMVTDPVTGETMYLRSPEFEEIIPVEDATSSTIQGTLNEAFFSYKVGDSCSVSDNNSAARPVQCLYIGQYCTVWGSTADPENVCITEAMAKEIADAFDSYYPSMMDIFGTWYDADGDEKLAIFCYDISKNAENDDRSSAYYGGFFHSVDLMDSNGYANGVYVGVSNYNGMTKDCIHLDTYPGMGGYDAPLSNVSRAYSTLVHEFQHLINYSYALSKPAAGTMEKFLNEAFSMAAEHMICSSDSTANRVTYFNNSAKYVSGTSLTAWAESLSNYSNSYLFGQYLRTRYGQMTDSNGNAFFKEFLQKRLNKAANESSLDVVAELLKTTPKQLVLDFWTAVYTKASVGPYGFNGESWADAISANLSTDTSGIYNGGVKFYAIPEEGFTVQAATNVEFVELKGIIDRGTCGAEGDNLTWTLVDTDEDGKGDKLTISGVGAMADYGYSNAPWAKHYNTIKTVIIVNGVTSIGNYALVNCRMVSVTIPDSVTSIGDGAFDNCTRLTSVTIPDSVTSIGKRAFDRCLSLASVTIGNSVTSIDSSAFADCHSLISVTIPNSVTSIGSWAFKSCRITSVTIPDSVTWIGNGAFGGCDSLTSIQVDSSNSAYTSVDGVVFTKDMKILVQYPCGKAGAYTIPDSVTTIGYDAFYSCNNLTAINVTPVNTSYASLSGVVFTKDMKTLVQYPCGKAGAYAIPDSVTSIDNSAFSNCGSLTSVTIPDSVTSIGMQAFSNCDSLTSVTIGNSVTSIGNNAFYSCDSLTSVTIGSSVTHIGDSAFNLCCSLTSVTIPNSVTSIGNGTFDNCGLTSVIIPDSVTKIGDFAFHRCQSLTSVTIPDSVMSIGNGAFTQCYDLTDVYYGGTEEEWKDIDIKSNNSPLLDATIHFGSLGGGRCTVENAELQWIITFAENSDAKKLTISASQTKADTATAFLVIYSDQGQMLGIETAKLTRGENGTLELTLPEESKKPTRFKLILLNGDSSPLTTAMGSELDI